MEEKLTALLRELRSDKDAIEWTPPALERLVQELEKESRKLVSDRADALCQAQHTKQSARAELDESQ